jgi:hypothetical protein
MRARFALTFALLALPVIPASAQRLPLPRDRRPVQPAELPPQPGSIAREFAYTYRRLPYSAESYPLVSYNAASAPVTASGLSSWVSWGVGQRIDYRVAPAVSATIDFTSSLWGAPVRTETFELGMRLRPDRNTARLYPFLDLRVGYLTAFQSQFRPFDVDDQFGSGAPGPGSRWSRGFGAVGGAGMEYALSRMFSLTTSAMLMRSRLNSRTFLTSGEETRYWLTTYRYTVGLRFNPVRTVQPPAYPNVVTPQR